jgi:hypothetical protein
VAGTFSQQFCTLVPCRAGGRIAAGRRAQNCLVQVADGQLVIVMAPAVLLARVPAHMVEIVTPPALRKIGTSVVLWLGGLDGAPLFAVEFDTVYRSRQARARRTAADPQSRSRAPAGLIRQFFRVSDITTLPQAMHLGRELAREFTTALLTAGAVSHADASGYPLNSQAVHDQPLTG